PSGQQCWGGSWTPDGRYFLFICDQRGELAIWANRERRSWFGTVNPNPVRLTTGPLRWTRPMLSRDGAKIFVVVSQSQTELVSFDRQSSQFVPFLDGLSAEMVEFSRDGKWVSYVTNPERDLWR